jgi:uncharacterized repeat protein (TIGR01451 family)
MSRSQVNRPSFTRRLLLVFAGVVLFAAFLPEAHAIDIPPVGASAYIQTTGPGALLNIGDYYTNVNGGNQPDGHRFEIAIPCDWLRRTPVLPITFALYDPEVAFPNPLQPNLPAEDEIRNPQQGENRTNSAAANVLAGNTTFTLRAANGAVVTKTFTPNGGTNGLWVELATFDPSAPTFGCGPYVMTAQTADNDDNAWRLRVTHDPECTVTPGTCSQPDQAASDLIGNEVRQDDADNTPGTGDELVIGMLQTSYQHVRSDCQDFYFFIDGRVSPVQLHNFDLDIGIDASAAILYTLPNGTTAPGTLSGNTTWNDPNRRNGSPQRVGDSFVIDEPGEIGWWRATVCVGVTPRNQYVFEGPGQGEPVYFDQPPTPVMVVSKDDGRTVVSPNEILTYSLVFTNTSNLTDTPGAATNVVFTDTLPLNATYVNCAINAPYTGSCAQNGGDVVFRIDQTVAAGASGSASVSVRVNPDATSQVTNTVRLTYQDTIGNPFPPVTDEDITRIPSTVAIDLERFTATVQDSGTLVQWETSAEQNTWGFHVLYSADGTRANATRVTPELILSRGRGQGGTAYSWLHTGATTGAYWLQEVELGGAVNEYGPATVTPGVITQSYRLFVPLALQ